jgi:hypothetical protein
MQHELAILDHTGDTKVKYDPTDTASTQEAQKAWDDAKAKGYLAYAVRGGDGSSAEVLREFDPTAPQIVMSPQLVGG